MKQTIDALIPCSLLVIFILQLVATYAVCKADSSDKLETAYKVGIVVDKISFVYIGVLLVLGAFDNFGWW